MGVNYLIVVDMQKDFIDGALGTKEAIAVVPRVVKKVQEFVGQVIFTRDTHEKDYLTTQEGKKLPVEHCIRGSEGWKICSDLKLLAEGEEIFDKPSFGSKELAEYLYEKNNTETIESITLIGLCTDICVISNALVIKAYLPEVKLMVDANCCAGVTTKSHENALSAMSMCQVEII